MIMLSDFLCAKQFVQNNIYIIKLFVQKSILKDSLKKKKEKMAKAFDQYLLSQLDFEKYYRSNKETLTKYP